MDLEKSLEDKFDPNKWQGYKAFESYKYSGINLIEEVNKLDPDLVIDVGCGHNRFKGHIKNLIGFDREPFPFADIYMSIDEINFRPESADVLLILGSIQFGTFDLVERHMDKVIKWLKPGGFIVMRCMQRHLRDVPYSHQNAHYIWKPEDIEYFTKKYDLTIHKGPWDENVFNFDEVKTKIINTRKVWWWKKPGILKKNTIDPYSCKISERKDLGEY